jgi:hypothetical protein
MPLIADVVRLDLEVSEGAFVDHRIVHLMSLGFDEVRLAIPRCPVQVLFPSGPPAIAAGRAPRRVCIVILHGLSCGDA